MKLQKLILIVRNVVGNVVNPLTLLSPSISKVTKVEGNVGIDVILDDCDNVNPVNPDGNVGTLVTFVFVEQYSRFNVDGKVGIEAAVLDICKYSNPSGTAAIDGKLNPARSIFLTY